MKTKLVTEESIRLLQKNLKENFEESHKSYVRHKTIDGSFEGMSLLDKLDITKIVGETEIPNHYLTHDNQIELEVPLLDDGRLDETDLGNSDFTNAVKIYKIFDWLTPQDANDARFWIYLTHGPCHKYVVERFCTSKNYRTIAAKGEDGLIPFIKKRFFFSGKARKVRISNAISRLWWIAYLTRDSDTADETQEWVRTKEMFSSQDYIASILERKIGSHPEIVKAVLTFFLERPDLKSKKNIQMVMRELNNLSGVQLVSLMSWGDLMSFIDGLEFR